MGDHKTAKSVFDIDSVQLLKIAKGMNDGYDMMGNELTSPTDLCLGAVVNVVALILKKACRSSKKVGGIVNRRPDRPPPRGRNNWSIRNTRARKVKIRSKD